MSGDFWSKPEGAPMPWEDDTLEMIERLIMCEEGWHFVL